jgi:hypothetical protein
MQGREVVMSPDAHHRPRWPYLLLIVPFIALLWVPFYNSIEPTLWGIPFFYWYQFLWVILTSLLIIAVHWLTGDPHPDVPAADITGDRA